MSQICSLLETTGIPLTDLMPLEEFQAHLANTPKEEFAHLWNQIEIGHVEEVPSLTRRHREELNDADDKQDRVAATVRFAVRVRAVDIFVGHPLTGAALKIKNFASQLFEHPSFFSRDPLMSRRFEITDQAMRPSSLEWEMRNMPLYVARKQANKLLACVSCVGGSAEPTADDSLSASRRRGRKPTYDWPPFHAAVREIVNNLGRPHEHHTDKDWRHLVDLERYMQDWCDSNWPDKSPSESKIRIEINNVLAESRS